MVRIQFGQPLLLVMGTVLPMPKVVHAGQVKGTGQAWHTVRGARNPATCAGADRAVTKPRLPSRPTASRSRTALAHCIRIRIVGSSRLLSKAHYRRARVTQPGKKVLATILAAWLRVRLFPGRKHGTPPAHGGLLV